VSKRSPEALTAEHLEGLGYLVGKTSWWNPFAKIRVDLFGVADMLATRPGVCALVQATSRDHVSHRRAKILASDKARRWLEHGGERRIFIFGWGRTKAAGDYLFADVQLEEFREATRREFEEEEEEGESRPTA
jgi:hypothetical protein